MMNTIFSAQALQQLLVYRALLDETQMKQFLRLLSASADSVVSGEIYHALFYHLAEQQCELELSGNLWQNFIARLIWQDENFYTRLAEKNQPQSSTLSTWVEHDIPILKELLFFDWHAFAAAQELPLLPDAALDVGSDTNENQMQKGLQEIIRLFAEAVSDAELHHRLNQFYQQYGCGMFAGHLAFQWQSGLKPVVHPQFLQLADLVGYEYQKSVLLENTTAFVRGQKANHILLYGEKGTGKSSSVKALLHEFAQQGLRMVEITRQQFPDFALLMDSLKNRRFRFILFIDDLSFEASDSDYKYVKSCIEGSLENSADNVLIYATSNRRHLIRENWSDRQEGDSEVHISDTYQEKLSLSDRFGIALSYYAPDKEQYLQIVSVLAQKEGLSLPEEELRQQAMQWEKMYHGYSGRSARQFVNALCGRTKEIIP